MTTSDGYYASSCVDIKENRVYYINKRDSSQSRAITEPPPVFSRHRTVPCLFNGWTLVYTYCYATTGQKLPQFSYAYGY